jgi:hypothetical protein
MLLHRIACITCQQVQQSLWQECCSVVHQQASSGQTALASWRLVLHRGNVCASAATATATATAAAQHVWYGLLCAGAPVAHCLLCAVHKFS